MSEDEKTGIDVFGEAVPGEAVTPRHHDTLAGYRPRQQWRISASGRAYRVYDRDDRPETQDTTRGDDMPSYKTAFGSFLKQEDLQGKTPRVVIASVDMDDVKDNDSGKTEKKLVVHFVGKDKAMILNRTNCETLEEITGTDDYGSWVGQAVVLWIDPSVKFGGKTVGGLRVRASNGVAPPPPPPPVREPGEDDEDIGF